MEAGAWRQRRRQARGGPRPSPEGQRHSHHHVQRPDEHVARPDVLVGARRRGPPANERGSEDRRGAAVSVGGRGPGMDAVYRVRSGRKFYTHGKTPYRPRTLRSSATVSEAAVGSTTVNVLAGPTRLAAGPDARRGRPRREPVSRQPNSRILRSTRLNRVLTEIRIESDDCWDDVRRRPKREHFSRRNVGTFPESSTLPERERDCMQERHTRRLSRV